MKIKNLLSKLNLKGILLILFGLVLGWIFFHHAHTEVNTGNNNTEAPVITTWTCAMHPQIKLDHPGNCPICGMELIPLEHANIEADTGALTMSEEALKLAEIQTSIVTLQQPVKELRLYGKIQADERLIQTQAAHIPGRIEKLLVSFTGESVQKGQLIAQIYSPELITAQEELIQSQKLGELQPAIFEAAKEKLRQWKLTESQINGILTSGKIQSVFDVYATVSGLVVSKLVNNGDYITLGEPLYEIADLTNVWAMFDAYESDLPWIKRGDNISFTTQSQPGVQFRGSVSFIDPVINPQTRIARIRVEITNRMNNLKPEMFVTGTLKSELTAASNSLVIPQSSVLWTGSRSIVYQKLTGSEEPAFKMREIRLGPALGTSYIVLEGLNVGDEIVTNGTFVVDAAAQLAGKPSMMNSGSAGTSLASAVNMKMSSNASVQNAVYTKTEPSVNSKVNKKTTTQEVNTKFKVQLTTVYNAYLPLKNAFVKSDPAAVNQEAMKVSTALKGVDMKLLEGAIHMKWMNELNKLTKNIEIMSENKDIQAQRAAFAQFNDAFYQALKDFGLDGITTYYQFCPMAENGKGAFWLSEMKEIKNPYYGDAMLTCGETRETLQFQVIH